MTFRHTRHRRLLAAAAIVAAGIVAQPRQAAAQFVVFDPASLGQAVVDQVTRAAQLVQQALELAEAVQGVVHLATQIAQLDSTYNHMKEAAMGRVGQLVDPFAALAAADAQTLLNADFGSWQNRLSGTSSNVADALASLDGSSFSDFLVGELDAADAIGDADFRNLFPNNQIASDEMADAWTASREHGDRIRAADLATAEAAGRVTALLRAAQVDLDGRRGQTELSHTALQQAQIANQLTATEMQVALAQLQAIQVQQQALSRHEGELLHRAALERWVARERAAQIRATEYHDAIDGRRPEWLAAMRLVRP